jgi:predicted SAM-dependent methyltransferase
MKHDNKVMLNVASGVFVMKEYINIDNSPFLILAPLYPIVKYFLPQKHTRRIKEFADARKVTTVVRADCRKPLPFAENSVDHIFCSHFLEHLYRDDAVAVLRGFHSLLKKGGTVRLVVPDLRVYVDHYIETGDADLFVEGTTLSWPKRPSFLFRLFSVVGGFGLTHLWMYDQASLTKIVEEAGFTLIPLEETPAPTVESYKLVEQKLDVNLHLAAIK